MKRILVTTIQQYTMDRLRISLNDSYEVELLKQLSYKLFTESGEDITYKVKSLLESNEWDYTEFSNVVDVYVQEDCSIPEGTYRFVLYRDGSAIADEMISIAHMEDIRIEIDKAEILSLDTLHVTLKPIRSSYQSREMMKLLKFSIIDQTNVHFSDNFTSLQDVLSTSTEEEIKEFTLKLKPGKTLPHGYYDLRLTSLYKSRTFSLVEKYDVIIPFMTTTPPAISTINMVKQASTGNTVMSVVFNPFLEKGMLLDGKRSVIRNKDNKEITDYFDASRISTTSYSIAGIQYITRIDIPLMMDYYSLGKGSYTLKWSWTDETLKDLSYTFNVGWIVNALENIQIYEGKIIDFDLPEAKNVSTFLKDEKLIVELNGEEIDPTGIFSPLNTVEYLKTGDTAIERTDRYGLQILDLSKIEDGTYSFILWKDQNYATTGDDIYYEYLGNIDINNYLTPVIEEVYQSDTDTITVVLKKAQPIYTLKTCSLSLYDQYGRIDFSDRLVDIENSNIWEPGQTMADRFNVIVNPDDTLASGKYQFRLIYRGKESDPANVSLQYMETRRGFIIKIEQISINKIKIYFSEPQSRKFLLTTKFIVERQKDGENLEDRFEYLENVLKADQMTFTEFEIPMDHEDSFPSGRYRISFMFINEGKKLSTTIYAYDVELGYMTNNIPSIQYCIAEMEGNDLNLNIKFKNDLEQYLYDVSLFRVIRDSDGMDISPSFKDRDEWIVNNSVAKTASAIKHIMDITIPARDVKYTTIDRGTYTVVFSWDGVIDYLEDLEKKVFFEYYLPKLKLAEVVDMNMAKNWARVYFELEESVQYEFFEDLHVEVLDPSGLDATDMFDTFANSNNIDPSLPDSDKLSSNSFNVNITNVEEIQIGKYQFIFYHLYEDTDGTKIRQSETMYTIELTDALKPQIATAYQSAMNKFTLTLKNAIPRRLLEEMHMKFVNFNHRNHTDDFMTIDQSNEWPEDLREVTTFDYQIKGGRVIEEGTYLLSLYNGTYICDEYIFDIIHMEGAVGEIRSVKPNTLSNLGINFMEPESVALFRTLELHIVNEDGVDFSNKFQDLMTTLHLMDVTYMESMRVDVKDHIPAGLYNFVFQREYAYESYDALVDNTVRLPYMSHIYPRLYDVAATKLGDTMDGDDALVMWFDPPLEKDLFEHAKFGILNTLNLDMDFTDRFKPIETATLDTDDISGCTFINFATLGFGNMQTLNRDRYTIMYSWEDDYDYMKQSLKREVSLDYILFPFKSVEQLDTETIRCTFKSPVTGEEMLRSEIYIFTLKEFSNDDVDEVTDVDWSNQFVSLQESNKFESDKSVSYIDVRMGTRDPEKPAELILPPDRYKFIIAQRPKEDDEAGLYYVYAGYCEIDFLMNSSNLYCTSSIAQISYEALKYTFELYQYTNMLSKMTFSITREDPTTKDIIDYSNRFMDTYNANFYRRIKDVEKDIWEEGYYEDAEKRDIVIDEIHYEIFETRNAVAKLKTTMVLPAHTYKVGLIYNKKLHFEQTINLPFMTTTPPDIYNMSIVTQDIGDPYLKVAFYPLAEFEALKASSFQIMTYHGEYKDGSIRGRDVTDYFASVSASETVQNDEKHPDEIVFIKEIHIPIKEGAMIASGRYLVYWNWPTSTFFPQSKYIGGLNLLGQGIKSARTTAKDTIEVIFEETVLAKDVKNLNLAVRSNSFIDYSDRFMSMADANTDITDDTRTSKYHIKLADGEELFGNTYVFTLAEMVDEEDEDGEDIKVAVEMAKWSMNIVYLTTEFPDVERIDNLSTEKFDIVELTNGNASSYYGKDVQLLTSKKSSEIEELTSSNAKDYIDHNIRVYNNPAIDCLTMEIDDEVDASLVAAMEFTILDSDGNDVSDHFLSTRSSNRIEIREVLYAIKVKLAKFYAGEDVKGFDFVVETCDKRDITAHFLTIDQSNNFNDESGYKEFIIKVSNTSLVEKYDTKDLVVRMEDNEGKVIQKFKYELMYNSIETSYLIDIKLAPETTICPGNYNFTFKYTNEPDIEDCVYLYPFKYTGGIPFLSNKLGTITDVVVLDMENIDLVFSELTLPISAFLTFELRVVNEDGDALPQTTFEPLQSSNDFGEARTLEEIDEPGVIHLKLAEGATIIGGVYRFQFWMDIAANDSKVDAEEEKDPEDVLPDRPNKHSGEYKLWDAYSSVPMMFREMSNSVKSVEIVSIDTLKINLEKEIDISVIKKFALDLYNPLKDITYSDKFQTVENSNFFGRYVITTDSGIIMYSTDGSYWNRFDTGYDYNYTKCFYHESSGYYVAFTTNGKIIKFKEFVTNSWSTEKPVEVLKYGDTVKSCLNDYVLIGNTIIIVGNNGIILKGSIDASTAEMSLTNINKDKTITKMTLTAIDYRNNTLLVAGYRGTLLKSLDSGATWSTVATGILQNLTCITYIKTIIQIEGEEPEPSDDEEEELPTPEVEDTVEVDDYIIGGNNGTVLYGDLTSGFTRLDTDTSKSIFAIINHDNENIIAVGDAGLILNIYYTDDGYSTNVNEIKDMGYALRDIKWCGNKYYICSASGAWLTSMSGEKWTVNSGFGIGAMKSIAYVESQYHAEKANWFYVKLKSNEELSNINFYSGWEAPTLESEFCSQWDTEEKMDQHLNDMYTQFKFEDRRAKPDKFYHFIKKADIKIDEEEGEIYTENETYQWEECPGNSSPHSGAYYVRLREKTASPDNWIYGSDSTINLPYMTSKPGTVKDAIIHSPDDEKSVEFYKPYLEIIIDRTTENAFHYATYSVKRSNDNVDVTNLFKPMNVGELQYSGSLTLTGILLFCKDEITYDQIVTGDYILTWNWMALGKSDIVTVKFDVKTFKPMISSIDFDADNPGWLHVNLVESIDINYFKNSNKFELEVRKIPKDEASFKSMNEFNYYNYYDTIEESTIPRKMDESKVEIIKDDSGKTIQTKVKEFIMKIQEGRTMLSGQYVFKFYNTTKNFITVKEDPEKSFINVSCFEKDFKFELTGTSPGISKVQMMKYTVIPAKPSGEYANQYSGEGLEDMYYYMEDWESEGTLEDHIGDCYLDVDTYEKYYLVYKKGEDGSIIDGYEWFKPSDEPYLCITFTSEALPVYDSFLSLYESFTLNEVEIIDPDEPKTGSEVKKRTPLTQYFRQELQWFEYEYSVSRDGSNNIIKSISKWYIPFDPECEDFPGAKNAEFILNFKEEEGSPYKDITVENIVLPQAAKSYGNIKALNAFNPAWKSDGSLKDQSAGFSVKFEKPLAKSFIRSMTPTIKRILTDEEREKLGLSEKTVSLDVTSYFMSLSEANKEDFADEDITSMDTIYLFLNGNNFLDHAKYEVQLTATVESSNIFNEAGDTIKLRKRINAPWLSNNVPKDISASLVKSGSKNAKLVIEFMDTLPPHSDLRRSTKNNKNNGSIKVVDHKTKKDYSSWFRTFKSTTVKFKHDEDLIAANKDSIEKWVTQINIPMVNNAALPKGTFDVTLTFNKNSKLGKLPNRNISGVGLCQFKTTEVYVSKLGKIKSVKAKGKEMTIEIDKNKDVAGSGALAKSKAGQVLGVKNWKSLFDMFDLSMKKNKKDYVDNFKDGPKITNGSIKYTIRNNKLVNPGKYKFAMTKGNYSSPISPKTLEFQGLIHNQVGGAANDPVVWIINETNPDGKKNCRVYKTYKEAFNRIEKMRKLNRMRKYQQKLCKKCRKIKLLRTNKIKGCINTYDIPYEYNGGIAKFFKQLCKNWYQMRSKKVTISFPKGTKLNDNGKLVKSKKHPKKKFKYHCNTKPFKGYKFEKTVEGKGSEKQLSVGCAHYVKKGSRWNWEFGIANVKSGNLPKSSKKKIYFAVLVWRDAELALGFKATKKGKKPDSYKSYMKSLRKKVKSRKKEIARCSRCKKKILAERNGKIVGWGKARFPVKVMTKASMKGLPSLLNVAEKEGGYKVKKKKKNGCKSPSFVWAKTTMKKKKFAKLKCSNCKHSDPGLATDGFQGYYYS